MIQASTTPGQYTVVFTGDPLPQEMTLGDAAAFSAQIASEVLKLRSAVSDAQGAATELEPAGVAVDAAAASDGGEVPPDDGIFDVDESMTRAELNAVAQHAGFAEPESLATKADVVAAIRAARGSND